MMSLGFRFRGFTTAVFLSVISSFAASKPLEVWIMPNGANPQGMLEQRLDIFEKETGLKTKVVVLDWGEAWSVISKALETGKNAPAVLQLGTTWVSYFASKGELAKLDSSLKEIEPNRFTSVSWGTTGTDGDPATYSVPWFTDARALLGNKKLLARAGIAPEDVATNEGFQKALLKIKSLNLKRDDGTKVQNFAFPGKSDWNIPHNFAPWIWSEGGDFLKKDSSGKWSSNLLAPKTIQGIATYLNFVLDTIVDKKNLRDNTAQIAQRFNNGELAFILNTAEIVMQTRFDAAEGGLAKSRIGQDSIVVLPVPAGEAGSICFVGGSNLAIPQSMKGSADARKLLDFLVRDDNIDAYTKQIGFLPPLHSVLQNWSADPAYKVLVDNLKTGKSYPNIPEWTTIEGSLISLFTDIWGYLDVDGLYSEDAMYSTLTTYDQKINDILNVPESSRQKLTFEEFKKLWNSHVQEQSLQSPTDQNTEESSEGRRFPLTISLFVVAVICGFMISFMRKRKK